MKKLLFAGIAVSMLAACSNDEVVPVNNPSNAIKFGVTAENGTRASAIYCSQNPFTDFYVSAAFNNKVYIDKDYIVNKGKETPSWDNQSGLRYWPNKGEVTFYGYKNYEITWGAYDESTSILNDPIFKDFTVESEVASQVDLMYAVKKQEKGTVTNGVATPVKLNFRHALSQIVFNARNDNANLYVEITGVSVVNANGKGTYTFPQGDTDGTISHPDGVNSSEINANRGKWSNLSNLSKYDVVLEDAVMLVGNKNKMHLTSYDNTTTNDITTHGNSANAMLLIPQITDKFDVKTASTDKDEEDKYVREGSYFLVKCKIWNVSGESFDINKDVVLWPKNGTSDDSTVDPHNNIGYADVMIPADFNWDEGKKYTYTFVFGNGNGGYNPDPTDPDPDPVLVPISFEVDIDEFIPVSGGEHETGVPGGK